MQSLALDTLTRCYRLLDTRIEHQGAFRTSLEPLEADSEAPEPIRSMLAAGQAAGVGPFAAVAGAVAAELGLSLRSFFNPTELVIENGGDYWLFISEELQVGIYAGLSSFSGKIALSVDPRREPFGLACSSATVGPSLSLGKADAAIVLAETAALADAWATRLGNGIQRQDDLESALNAVCAASPSILGALAIKADQLAARGKITLTPLRQS